MAHVLSWVWGSGLSPGMAQPGIRNQHWLAERAGHEARRGQVLELDKQANEATSANRFLSVHCILALRKHHLFRCLCLAFLAHSAYASYLRHRPFFRPLLACACTAHLLHNTPKTHCIAALISLLLTVPCSLASCVYKYYWATASKGHQLAPSIDASKRPQPCHVLQTAYLCKN